jgi:hypothetical protein
MIRPSDARRGCETQPILESLRVAGIRLRTPASCSVE